MPLFEEYSYFNYQFPEPQYLGAKYNFLQWFYRFVPKNIKTAMDAFSGSQSVAYFFKQRGLQVFTNDFLNFNHQIGLSLIENSQITLSNEDIEYLLQPTQNEQFNLMQNIYIDIFFTNDQAQFLDSFRANIENLENPYKKALAFTIMNRSLTRKVTIGHFAHLNMQTMNNVLKEILV
jgi:adenine-specific DNA-methyltransferase